MRVPPREVRAWNERIFPLLRGALAARYFSLDVVGASHVPVAGPVVYVGNHSGWFALDALVFALALHDHVRPDRIPYAVVQDVLLRAPGLRTLFSPLGVIPASRLRDPAGLPAEIETFGVFPEGTAGICKPFWQAYRMRPWRSGFVRLARERRAAVVPCALVGGEESLPTLGGIRALERALGGALPVPLAPVPLPARWTIAFGPPLDVAPADAADVDACRVTAERIRGVTQSLLDEHTRDRPLRRLGDLR